MCVEGSPEEAPWDPQGNGGLQKIWPRLKPQNL